MKSRLGIVLFFCVMVFSACIDDLFDKKEKGDEIFDSSLGFDVEVKNNTLYFPSDEAALKAIEKLNELEPAKRVKWEQKVGFVSAQTELEIFREQIAKMDSEDDINQLIANNADFLIHSDNESSGIDSRIYGFYRYITGRKGIVYYGDFMSRVLDNKLYTTVLEDLVGIETICNNVESIDSSTTQVEVITLFELDENELKSQHIETWSVRNDTLQLFIYNSSRNRRMYYRAGFWNTQLARSIAYQEQKTTWYLQVFACNGCDMSNFYYTLNGSVYRFRHHAGNAWNIEVPDRDYMPVFHGNPQPVWDPIGPANYHSQVQNFNTHYNYDIDIRLHHIIISQKYRNINNRWVSATGDRAQVRNVYADVEIGFDKPGHSTKIESRTSGHNLNSAYNKGYEHKDDHQVYRGNVSRYTSKPIARFKCVKGDLKSSLRNNVVQKFEYNF